MRVLHPLASAFLGINFLYFLATKKHQSFKYTVALLKTGIMANRSYFLPKYLPV
ncbi:hypothetical protein P5673_028629 [Acropora cervicornis]|uniref:Uncharacterized protein n=1 Tax=Acropora cervicornis TaxID=6130 RepID=A0AAD9UUT3_ACRCE|nr:hypothetical protein P5673_028629 [Acropora cervicornis]